MKTYVVTTRWNRLNETVLMMGHKICFYLEIWLIIPKLFLLPLLTWNIAMYFSYFTGAEIGSPNEFTLLSVLQPNHKELLRVLQKSGQDAYEQNLLGYGIVNGFVSTVAQAYYQGKCLSYLPQA